MKKRMTRILLFLLLPALLAGCAAKTDAGTPADAQAETNVPAQAPAATAAPTPTPIPTPEPTPELKLFPWNGHTLCAASVLDDGSISMGTTRPTGRFIRLTLDCLDGTISWAELTGQITDFSLRDSNGNDYAALGSGMKTVDGEGFKLDNIESSEYAAIQPIFDIPAGLVLGELTLRVKTETAGETILVRLADVPLFVEPEEAE